MQNLISRNIHIVKGKVAKWAHAGLPEGTYEEEWGRYGFSGPVTHLYHRHPPTGWTNIEGPLRPHALSPLKMPVADSERRIFLHNEDVAMGIQNVVSEWDYFFRNGEADDRDHRQNDVGHVVAPADIANSRQDMLSSRSA